MAPLERLKILMQIQGNQKQYTGVVQVRGALCWVHGCCSVLLLCLAAALCGQRLALLLRHRWCSAGCMQSLEKAELGLTGGAVASSILSAGHAPDVPQRRHPRHVQGQRPQLHPHHPQPG